MLLHYESCSGAVVWFLAHVQEVVGLRLARVKVRWLGLSTPLP